MSEPDGTEDLEPESVWDDVPIIDSSWDLDGSGTAEWDTTGDGMVDFVEHDTVGDGVVDRADVDLDNDGTLDRTGVDTTGDGALDAVEVVPGASVDPAPPPPAPAPAADGDPAAGVGPPPIDLGSPVPGVQPAADPAPIAAPTLPTGMVGFPATGNPTLDGLLGASTSAVADTRAFIDSLGPVGAPSTGLPPGLDAGLSPAARQALAIVNPAMAAASQALRGDTSEAFRIARNTQAGIGGAVGAMEAFANVGPARTPFEAITRGNEQQLRAMNFTDQLFAERVLADTEALLRRPLP